MRLYISSSSTVCDSLPNAPFMMINHLSEPFNFTSRENESSPSGAGMEISNPALRLVLALPKLTNSLKELYCNYNSLTLLPELPNSLQILTCRGNFFYLFI
mgnify:CR=1 FL=1